MQKRSLFNPDGKPIAKCERHGRLPGAVVCPPCLNEQNERIHALNDALQRTPTIIATLFQEGHAYMTLLERIADLPHSDLDAAYATCHPDCVVGWANEVLTKGKKELGGLLSQQIIPEGALPTIQSSPEVKPDDAAK